MARVDDYIEAKRLAVKDLCAYTAREMADHSGFAAKDERTLRVPFLNRVYKVELPEFTYKDETDPGKEVPIQEQVILLHYLQGDFDALPQEDWVAYREIPGAGFYDSAFSKRAVVPLIRAFGNDPKGLARAAERLSGSRAPVGDHAWDFLPLPRVPVRMVLWEGDDEFPANANILFDRSAGRILSPEDLAWLAGMLVYRLMSLSR
ncbi:MAG: DUF3786 domain-containing protein [Proteobacteria bacterium]|nr:DUF3786 domain-containing protein [Pseudomonadota bacterium]